MIENILSIMSEDINTFINLVKVKSLSVKC